MKKALPLLVVAAVLAAAFFFFRKGDTDLDMAPGRAAELAPADSIVFIEFPEIQRSKSRWRETALRKIADEPEWKEFTAKWDEFAASSAEWRPVAEVLEQIERADPAGLFLACNSFEGPSPKIVGGFPYRGRKSDVQAVVSRFRATMLDAFPAAKAGGLTNYEGTEIETLKDKDMTLAMAYRDNWFLFATDEELLLKTLSRYIRKPGAPASLASDPLWKNTIRQGLGESDMTLFVRWSYVEGLMNDFRALAAVNPAAPATSSGIESLLYTAKMDGLLLRDRIYMRMNRDFKVREFANRSAAFTSPDTYAFFAGQVKPVKADLDAMLSEMEKSLGFAELLSPLAKGGFKLADVYSAIGDEVVLMSDWESGGLSLPTLFAAVELQDRALARRIVDFLLQESGGADEVKISEEDGATLWKFGALISAIEPTLAMTEKHLVFGLNSPTVKDALKRAKAGGGQIVTRSDYQAGLKTLAPASGGVGYMDFKTLFERAYEKARPLIAMGIMGQPEAAKFLDPSKLPKAETISRHLLPMVMTTSEVERGWQVDCAGSVSIFQAYIPSVLGGVLMLRSRAPVPLPVGPAPAAPVPGGGL